MTDPATEERFRQLVRQVEDNAAPVHSLGIGDRIAVALILNRLDLLPSQYTHSVLEAIERLGDYRLKAALAVQGQESRK